MLIKRNVKSRACLPTKEIIVGLILMVMVFGLFSGCAASKKESKDNEVVKDMVNKYLTALKNKDIDGLLSMSGVKIDEEMKKQVVMGLKQVMETAVDLDIKDFKIKKVEVDGGIAFVTVEETRKMAPKGTGAPAGFETGYKTVEETIVLIKRDGKWKIDAINTLHLSQIDMKDTQKAMSELNNMGMARVFALVVDPDIASLGINIAAIAAPNFLQARGQGQFTQCQSNMKNIGTALEMYSTDHSGHYPKNLKQLTPEYLKFIPTCASAGKDTYSESYESTQNPDTYEFCCSGSHHSNVGVPPNYPKYDSTRGLTSRPSTGIKRIPRRRDSSSSPAGDYTMCQSNLKNMGTALEMYSTDHAGHYPKSLKQLTPDYLRVIPTCPAAGKDTYSGSYKSTQSPDTYEFYCSGSYHSNVGVPTNYPQYNSTDGLKSR
ncbi:MAG: nuclear transport factor 2 family protein [Candidatus Eremiobacteraeota bacterium]|nr:nuclear transport factor 2 family protein [Candidatus Eremiobacteraeota bacterium]